MGGLGLIVAVGILLWLGQKSKNQKEATLAKSVLVEEKAEASVAAKADNFPADASPTASSNSADQFVLVGPRGNVPDGAPKKKEFKLFAIPVPGALSRSGQPTLANFQ